VEDVDEEEVSVYPGRVYRLSAHVSQTMFTENSTELVDEKREQTDVFRPVLACEYARLIHPVPP